MSKKEKILKPKDRILVWRESIELPRQREPPEIESQPSSTRRLSHNSAPDIWAKENLLHFSPEFSDETITLHAGPEASARSFRVRKELFYSVTTCFKATDSEIVVFPADLFKRSIVGFDMFTHWLKHREDPRPYIPLQYSKEPWRSHSAAAWVFARRIHSLEFERYALSHFITNCITCHLSTWKTIEMKIKEKTSLRRFSDHWIAWRCHLAEAGQSEFKDLSAAKLASAVNDDTPDPRILDLDHWYSSCGDDINSTCIHDPVVRENEVNALFSSREPRPEWGYELEMKNQAPQEESTPWPSEKAAVKPPILPPRKATR
ncbi:uncharacterized protein A1O9_01708 [Exophiala aquamarina CBS 119918]|uniref:Uncharacterized protein n=1 Tax=Exophiala aquamarina CBS 119918 TaxID=1182545 RepID=A0A072Q722_9EURO|nr:uncharacterized protein A1O9_01708 [Exophiala aquamarina CBS 119918]KEF63730.1 hypothetical protein A1O9_01708 [Exophiala aquamarina CBS 119918]